MKIKIAFFCFSSLAFVSSSAFSQDFYVSDNQAGQVTEYNNKYGLSEQYNRRDNSNPIIRQQASTPHECEENSKTDEQLQAIRIANKTEYKHKSAMINKVLESNKITKSQVVFFKDRINDTYMMSSSFSPSQVRNKLYRACMNGYTMYP
jgi:hypothetical protein